MFNVAVVTLREAAELLFLAEALCLWLRSVGRPGMTRLVQGGMAAGALAALGGAAWVHHGAIEPSTTAVLNVVMLLVVVVVACGMLSSANLIRSRAQDKVEQWIARPAFPVFLVAGSAFFGLRETLEWVVLADVFGAGRSDLVMEGTGLGLVAVAGLVGAYRSLERRASLLGLFRVSTLVVALFAIQRLIEEAGALARARLADDSAIAAALQPFLEGGSFYPWLCALLMTGPLLIVARGWWSEARED